ncbi:MAG: type II toxin-antitoxin system VapC family toxin [Candidatus Heimdallarchaeota archaeon]|nr:type II toxin-antitoxin system VapC family toxin [Candidatus Heimdallarchaeota archaeon]
MRYFIDTSFMVGLANPKDKYHKEANDIFEKISENSNSEVFISDYVIDEFLNIVLKGRTIQDVIDWGSILFSEELANIVYSNQAIIKSAWELLQDEKSERKPLNFTDCVVLIKNKLLRCDEILTFDDRLKNF